ncbi:uncharacterized protein LOC136086386 [Hydra vulgaris]|uniref:Uncharacterized protein LOC136086386 n=1 Tax=Hydra vulgaris TaxID=6087 RepID=A0ABM4CS84_HYDVU
MDPCLTPCLRANETDLLPRPNDFLNIAEFDVVFGLARKYIDKNKFKDLLIMGDFNFPSINWSNGCVDAISNENGTEYEFIDVLNDNFFYQRINIPTFQLSYEQLGSTLDLIFTTQSASVNEIDSKFVLGNITRGHLSICFSFILSDKAIRDNKSKQTFMFANSNFELISDLVSNVDWIKCFSNKNVQEMLDELIFYTEVACKLFTPIKKTFNSLKIRQAWVNARLKFLIRSKQILRYKNCSCKWNDPVLKSKNKVICKNLADDIKKVRQNFESNLVKKAIKNPKLLYSYMNNQQAVKDTLKALKGENGITTQYSKDIVDILNKNFQAAFVKEDDGPLPSFDLRTTKTFFMTNEDFTYEDFYLRLKNLKDNKSSGVDNLHSAILKNCASAFAIPLTYIFKELFKTSQLPAQFRSANITPLYKKGQKTLAGNYRSVSLTSSAVK